MCLINAPECLDAIQDVETTWWSTFVIVDPLLCLENTIKLQNQVDEIGALFSATCWAILRLLWSVIDSFMTEHTLLGGKTYVTVSLLTLYISDLQYRLKHAMDNLKLPASSDDHVEIGARKAVISCVEPIVKDFDSHWKDDESVLVYKKGKKTQ